MRNMKLKNISTMWKIKLGIGFLFVELTMSNNEYYIPTDTSNGLKEGSSWLIIFWKSLPLLVE